MGILRVIKKKFYNIPFSQRRKIISIVKYLQSFGKSDDLNFLALLYKTDKFGHHFYTPHYMVHFKPWRNKKFNFLEIGVGGYNDPFQGGGSLRMWKRYFSKAKIFALDIFDKVQLQESRISIFQASQVDFKALDEIIKKIGEVEIIVDDGSHINEHIIQTFEFLFPKLKSGGIYVVEDVQTSYWPEYGGNSVDFYSDKSAVGYFKKKVDGLNYLEFRDSSYQPSYFDRNISSIHFYHNLIFIYKI